MPQTLPQPGDPGRQVVWITIDDEAVAEVLVHELRDVSAAFDAMVELRHGVIYGTRDSRLFRWNRTVRMYEAAHVNQPACTCRVTQYERMESIPCPRHAIRGRTH